MSWAGREDGLTRGMWNRGRQSSEPRPVVPGVADTIGLAFSRLVARPWVVLGPILLDLYLWLGLRLTAGPLMLRLADVVRPVERVGTDAAELLEGQRHYNLAELLSFQLPSVRFPTFLPLLVDDTAVRPGSWRPELSDMPWWALAALAPFLLAGGVVLGSVFLLWLADVARGLEHNFDGPAALLTGARLMLWALAAAGLFILICWPLLVAQAALVVAGVGGSGIIVLLLVIPAGLGFVLFFFSPHAIVVDRSPAIDSFRSSYRVVRRFGWQSLGFIASYMIVTGAFPFFWRLLTTQTPGTLIAIIGNAFVSSGMVAAGMIYYEDRRAIAGVTGATV